MMSSGSFQSRSVASSPSVISMPASPTTATTGRSGAASLKPMASGTATPMVQSAEDCSSVLGAGQSGVSLKRMRWAPLSAVKTVSAGAARRAAAKAAWAPQLSRGPKVSCSLA